MEIVSTLTTILLPMTMIVAAASDVTSFRIPNWLTGFIALSFVPMAYAAGMPLEEFGWHLLVGVILFFVGYGLFALRIFGGGDSKLMAAAGLWLGANQTPAFLVLTGLAGGVLAVVILLLVCFQIQIGSSETGFRNAIQKLTPKVPYGFALAVGAILAFPGSWWMSHVS